MTKKQKKEARQKKLLLLLTFIFACVFNFECGIFYASRAPKELKCVQVRFSHGPDSSIHLDPSDENVLVVENPLAVQCIDSATQVPAQHPAPRVLGSHDRIVSN